jgi:hypothetical protein
VLATRKKKKRRKLKVKLASQSPLRRPDKTAAKVPPCENLQKFPDETYGDMQLPFPRGQ